jgi:hypothetical protein
LAILIECFEIAAHAFGLLWISLDVLQQFRAGGNSARLQAE